MNSGPEHSAENYGSRIIEPEISLAGLTQLLIDGDIPVDEYGQGEAKDIDDLLKEVAEGECTIHIDPTGKITRQVTPICVNVLCHLGDSRTMLLREDRQEFRDGRVRRRQLNASLGEKRKAGEDIYTAAVRALREETGVSSHLSLVKTREEISVRTSRAFPGIESTYSFTYFDVVIPETSFVAEGYVEEQPKKVNYYVWDEQA